MSDIAIRADGIGKRYRIGQRVRYKALRDTLTDLALAPVRATRRLLSPHADGDAGRGKEYFWALKDISFEIRQGEVVGLIGRNGAGKSTLLKILSRITEPTEGRAELFGRVGSLLEVGTGFHPELTGRENIFLNGAILGMKRTEIAAKFDEIVAFAEIEKFLETPVKHYSSGMYTRLAFSVAAHLEPEILLVDEVLAVGDAAFQKKCLGRMGEVAREGRTVILVSHNMNAIQNVCEQAMLLTDGRIHCRADVRTAVQEYWEQTHRGTNPDLTRRQDRDGDGRLRFTSVEFEGDDDQVKTTGPLTVRIGFDVLAESVSGLEFSMSVNDMGGQHMLVFNTREQAVDFGELRRGTHTAVLQIPTLPLVGGRYPVNFFASSHGAICDFLQRAALLDVDDSDFYPRGAVRHPAHPRVVTTHEWTCQ